MQSLEDVQREKEDLYMHYYEREYKEWAGGCTCTIDRMYREKKKVYMH